VPVKNSSSTTRLPACPKGVVLEAVHDGLARGLEALADRHALAGGETIGLDDDLVEAMPIQERDRIRGALEGPRLGPRHVMALAELTREGLAAFDLGRLLVGAEDRESGRAHLVAEPRAQRRLRADDDEADLLLLREVDQLLMLIDVQGHTGRVLRDTAVARGDEDLVHLGRLRDLPRQGVFAPPSTDHQYVHSPTPLAESAR
jgi:hypothetical protein